MNATIIPTSERDAMIEALKAALELAEDEISMRGANDDYRIQAAPVAEKIRAALALAGATP